MEALRARTLLAIVLFVALLPVGLLTAQLSNRVEIIRGTVVDPGVDPKAPQLSVIDLRPNRDGIITMPDVSTIWVQGRMSDPKAIVTTTVNDGDPIRMNVREDQKAFGYLIPLEVGTNHLVITATNVEGRHNDYPFTVVRSRGYRGAITSPAFGSYANGRPSIVKGYVSSTIDADTPNEAHVESVFVNGVPTKLGPVDKDGNIPFETIRPVPLDPKGGPTAYSVKVHWSEPVARY